SRRRPESSRSRVGTHASFAGRTAALRSHCHIGTARAPSWIAAAASALLLSALERLSEGEVLNHPKAGSDPRLVLGPTPRIPPRSGATQPMNWRLKSITLHSLTKANRNSCRAAEP